MNLYLSDVAKAVGGRLVGADRQLHDIMTDSRRRVDESLFVALAGDNFDGHDYIEAAHGQGAVAALVEREMDCSLPLVVVANTRAALGKLAAAWRSRFAVPLIAVTGSNGKTTVKELLAAILQQCGPVLATKGNLNNEIGVPLTLLSLRQGDRFAVVEMGANHSGEIAYLSSLARPDVVIITNAAPAHLEGFNSIEEVAEAKGEIIDSLGSDGTAVLNADDRFFDDWCKRAATRRVMSFGMTAAADVSAAAYDEGNSAASLVVGDFKMKTPAGEISVNLPLSGEHNIKNALAAAAACLAIGIDLEVVKKGLESAVAVQGRLNIKKCADGLTVIDDSYNANPASVEAALLLLARQHGKRRLLVLGDMAELGDEAKRFHFEIGRKACELGIDCLYATGSLSRSTVEGFGRNGFYFDNKEQLIGQLREDLARYESSKTIVLVKASRSSRLETVARALVEGGA